MKTRLISAALAALLATASGIALAQDAPPPSPPPPPHGGMFMHADANKDGIVTRAELLADVDGRFGKVDANHDGKITADERQAAGKAMREARTERGGEGRRGKRMVGPGMRGPRADADKDGVVTLDEVRAPALKLFAYVDRNNDGNVDKAESESFRDATRSMHGPRGPRHGGHGRHGRHAPPPAGTPDAPPGQ